MVCHPMQTKHGLTNLRVAVEQDMHLYVQYIDNLLAIIVGVRF